MLYHIARLKRKLLAQGGNPNIEVANPYAKIEKRFKNILVERAFHIETSYYALVFIILRLPRFVIRMLLLFEKLILFLYSTVNRILELTHPNNLFYYGTLSQGEKENEIWRIS